MQLNTFFCRRGVDSNIRFALINIGALLLVSLFDVLLGSHGLLLVISLLFAVVVGLSTLRRLQGQRSPLIILPTMALLMMSIGLIYQWHILSAICVCLQIVSVVVIGLRPLPGSIYKADGFGYSGPLAVTSNGRRRVEPTLATGGQQPHFATVDDVENSSVGHQTLANDSAENRVGADNFAATDSVQHYASYQAEIASEGVDGYRVEGAHQQRYREEHQDDTYSDNMSGSFSQMMSDILSASTKAAQVVVHNIKAFPKVVGISFVAVLSLGLVWILWPAAGMESDTEQTVKSSSGSQTESQGADNVSFKTAQMPDGFSVLLDGDALLLKWLGERGDPGLIWSLKTAKGDSSCQNVTFNNGTQYRPVEVNLMKDTSTVARFSPLDTKAIIQDIAMRGNLTMCGYQFSLKGSQAALAKEVAFRPYL
ncbi:hypothetical protein [Shewanella sp. Isolate11]|uniref:hypothetical protein n=1 Tax=Shewanella sp. Isolate11 TaxID=2908530 RepID=UPI001EFC2E08|nr:hypothetical protein [Shewanella sp. Isolate11]MCG9697817.1 hypothetical protein [Shewanella sp. Isolate11]